MGREERDTYPDAEKACNEGCSIEILVFMGSLRAYYSKKKYFILLIGYYYHKIEKNEKAIPKNFEHYNFLSLLTLKSTTERTQSCKMLLVPKFINFLVRVLKSRFFLFFLFFLTLLVCYGLGGINLIRGTIESLAATLLVLLLSRIIKGSNPVKSRGEN